MNRRIRLLALMAAAVLLLCGCGLRTVEQMYALPKRSAEYYNLQTAIDGAMGDLEYAAPVTGENQQTVQTVDLDGDGVDEYLLFARGNTEKPLKILIFSRNADSYVLSEIIESQGSAFELVEYVNLDDRPGVELVVGRQVSDQVLRSVSVYTFSDGQAQQLMAVSYYKFVTCDLDSNGRSEIMVISSADTEGGNAIAALYSCENSTMVRSAEANLSQRMENIKRIMVSRLHGNVPAVYVASSVEESAIITDVFALKEGHFTNVSFSNESGTSVQTLRNYYVYADDIDDDGVLELPSLISMPVMTARNSTTMQYLIRWYAMTLSGEEVDKMYTFHNYDAGWYLRLSRDWAQRVSVNQEGSTYHFFLWDESFKESQKLFTVYALTGSDREEAAVTDNRFVLYRGESVVYAARLEPAAASYEINQERLVDCFRFIQTDWKTGET